MTRSAPTTLLILAATAVAARAAETTPQAFLGKAVSYTPAQIAAADAGQVVTRLLPSADKPEIAVFGAVRVRGDAVAYVRQIREGTAMRRGPSILEAGRFSRPPVASDVASLTLEDGDFKAARECRPGACDIKMSRPAMERMHREIDFKAPDARARTTDVMRQMLADYVGAYIEGGTAAMAIYVDKERPLDTSAEFKKLLAASPYLLEYEPAFHRYLQDFPRATLAGAEDTFTWTKDKFGPKPTISIYHTTLWVDPAEAGRTIIGSKLVYASHYFQTGLDVLAVVPVTDGGFYLLDLYRVRIDPPTGMLSGVILGKIRGGVEQGVAEGLKAARAKAEAK